MSRKPSAQSAAVGDANLLIAYLSPDHSFHRASAGLVAGYSVIHLHPLNLAEVLVGVPATDRELRIVQWREAGFVVANLFDQFSDETARLEHHALRLAEVREQFGVKMPDACALLVAIELELPLLTFDQKLARAAAIARPAELG